MFLTDVIGFLPVDPEQDPRELDLTADYNGEMIAQRSRYPRLRDLSLYVGSFDDLPDARFGHRLIEGDERIRATYRGNYDRLRDVKTEYDPRNLFRSNQNIPPKSWGRAGGAPTGAPPR